VLPFQMSSITAVISTVSTMASRRALISLELFALLTLARHFPLTVLISR
jgi:hypothetical protein